MTAPSEHRQMTPKGMKLNTPQGVQQRITEKLIGHRDLVSLSPLAAQSEQAMRSSGVP